jgi:hypothetical protein
MSENLNDWLVAEQVASAAFEAERNARDPEQIRARKKAQYRSLHKDRIGDELLPGARIKTKPAVPKRSEAPPARSQPEKNFIMVNAITNILSGEFPRGRKEVGFVLVFTWWQTLARCRQLPFFVLCCSSG